MQNKTTNLLVITVPSWNSKVGSNTWESLLQSYSPKNIANLCIRDELPDSDICSRYFAISENKIIKSVFNRTVCTGKEITATVSTKEDQINLEQHNGRYKKMQKRRRYSMLLAREIIWKFGKWKTPELDAFLDSFQPDIILHSMEGYIHLNRIIKYAIKRTGAKAAGYIWDDNFTYKQSNKLGYKIYRFFQRRSLKRLAQNTQAFFAISDKTKQEADAFFGINCQLLTKPLNSEPSVNYNVINTPLKMIYTGNLYIGRDRSLAKISKALQKINEEKTHIQLDVYTATHLQTEQKATIENQWCVIHPPVPQSDVLRLQKEADILLFLEDIDGPDAKVARLSFSTKTTDYLSAGKCIFAVGNPDTAPMDYFIKNNAAIIASSEKEITDKLLAIIEQPDLMITFAKNACECGLKNHNIAVIQKTFDETLNSIIDDRIE